MGFGSHDSSVGNPEIEAADEKMRNNGHALVTGAQLVTMGGIRTLVRLQAQAIWEMSVCASGSTGTLYSGYQIYDAIDLVPTSSITNASVVTSISLSPSNPTVGTSSQTTFTATARDQFGNVIPANFTWSTTNGTVDGTGAYTAPAAAGSGMLTATSGSVNGSTNITIIGPPTLTAAISRKLQGSTSYDLALPLSGSPAVEPRTGGPTTVILTFGQTLDTSAALSLSLTSGTGSASYLGSTQISISMSGATDGQTLGITVGGVRRPNGSAGSYTVNIGVLLGDVDQSGAVNVSDVITEKLNSGATVSSGNFLMDLNCDGSINVADVITAKLNSGHVLVAGGGQAALVVEIPQSASVQSSSAPAALIENDGASPASIVEPEIAELSAAILAVAPSMSDATTPPDTVLMPASSTATASAPLSIERAGTAASGASDLGVSAIARQSIVTTVVGKIPRRAENVHSSIASPIAREPAIRDMIFAFGGYDSFSSYGSHLYKKKSLQFSPA
jgi:hypothetical protein